MDNRPDPRPPEDADRRGFLSRIAMLLGLASGYGAFAAIAGRFLYPARPAARRFVYVTRVASLEPGAALLFRAPGGETINLARQGATGTADDFVALSSVCPHLGCQVHWEGHNRRFFCPCHNGVFDPSGKGIGGPPGEAGQDLARYPVKVEGGLVYLEVRTGGLTVAAGGEVLPPRAHPCGLGHDPCLARLAGRSPEDGTCRS